MHANDMLKYGHTFLMKSLEGLDETHLTDSGVCGDWSVKDIMAHLAAAELLLVEVLEWVKDNNTPTPLLQNFGELRRTWNDSEVDKRKEISYQEVFNEYNQAYEKNIKLIETVPLELQRKTGVLPWYGEEYDLEDFLVYTFYAHKREHGAQISLFKDRLKTENG